MTTAYTSLLGLALPVTGELDGTWGDVVNNYITQYTDASVAGTQTISGSQTAVTLSTTNGSALSQAGSGSTGSAQYQIINCTGNPASTLTITAPATSKTYIVINQTSTSQSVVVRGAGPTTGVTVASGDKALIAWNGSDFVRIGASAGGSNTQVQYNSGGNLAGSANLTFDGTTLTANDFVDSSLTANKPVFTNGSKNLVSTGTLGADQGGTGQTSLTLNNVILGNGTSAVQFVAPGTNGNVLVSNGTTWVSQAPAASGVSQAKATAIAMVFGI